MLNLKIYKINQNAIIPKQATEQAACFDISACGSHVVPAKHTIAISTGLILDIPVGYSVRIHPRSGLAYKKGITLLNAEGIIDSDYTDELKILLYNTSNMDFIIQHGDRIAQGELVKNLDYVIEECYNAPVQKTDRVGGFGSTGVSS
jgi:dUTP pyrophosphatase